jgi:hypothetical protein
MQRVNARQFVAMVTQTLRTITIKKLKYCHVLVKRRGVWIGNCIYLTLRTRNYK